MGGFCVSNFGCFPGRGRNVARAGKQLPHAVVGIHWLEGQKTPTGRRLPKELERRKERAPVLHRPLVARSRAPPPRIALPKSLERCRAKASSLLGRRRRIEDDVIKDQAGAVPRQPFQEWHVQGSVPDVIDRLVQLLGRFFVQINENDFVGVQSCPPNKRQDRSWSASMARQMSIGRRIRRRSREGSRQRS